ncbi:MAG TPA: hypothetical protein VF948_03740 [Methylomirabilota bacterium]
MRRIQRGWQAAGILALALLFSPTATVQAAVPAGAGVATAVIGQVTVSHAASPTPQALHFKDEVFLQDRISTAARSLARLLLGKKALLTVRELSELELIDQSGISTVQLFLGKVAIGVARQRMLPGETVEIRTQNAVAAIRGTVVVAEMLTAPGSSIPITRLHVLSGYIDVTTPGNPGAPPLRLIAPSSVTVTGNTMDKAVSLSAAARVALLSDLQPSRPNPARLLDALVLGEQARAAALGRIITRTNEGGKDLLEALQAPPVNTQAPITPIVQTAQAAPSAPGPYSGGGGSALPFVFNSQIANVPSDLYQVAPASTQSISTDLLRATNSTVSIGGEILEAKGSLNTSTTLPLLSLDASTVRAVNLGLVGAGGQLSLGSGFLAAAGGTLTATDHALKIFDDGRLTSSGAASLFNISGTTVNIGDEFFEVLGAGSSATLAGSLLTASASPITVTGTALVRVDTSASLTSMGAAPFVSLTGGSLTLASTGFLFGTGSTSAFAGGLLSSNATDIAAAANLLNVTGTVTSSGAGALLSLTNGTVSVRNVALVGSGGRLSLAGGLLERNGATLKTIDDLLNISAGGRLTGAGTGALLSFTNATANVGNAAGDQYFQVTGAGSSATLAGPLLMASGASKLTLTGSALLDVSTSGTLTSTTTSPIVSLTGGTLALAGASGFSASSLGTANLAGGLLSTSGTDITSTGNFVLGQTKGRFVTAGTAAPLLSLAGGNSHLATDGSIFRLIGTTTALDAASGLIVGTEQPIQHAGGFLDMNAATVTTARVVRVDVALLEASAPLLNLFGTGGAQLTTSSNAIDLTSKAKVTDTGAFVTMDQSRLTVNNAALVNVAGASYLKGGGNLVNLANGSTLTINNGVLLFVSGGSIVNISGALIAFSGFGGNTVNISNTLAFVNIGGIPVALTGGALAANVSIMGTPIKNPSLGTITPYKALIQVNGATTKLTISGN